VQPAFIVFVDLLTAAKYMKNNIGNFHEGIIIIWPPYHICTCILYAMYIIMKRSIIN